MANFNLKADQQQTYDAIIIGSGISGGWAAKELCEKGLKTLVLEKGRMVEHVVDYPTMHNESWDYDLRGSLNYEEQRQYHVTNTYKVGAMGAIDGWEDKYYSGRRPNGIYIPRYVNVDEKSKTNEFLRGFGYQGGAGRSNWGSGINNDEFGADFKENLFKPGPWGMFITGFGECLPYHENKVSLNQDVKDKWGLPTLNIDCEFKENELAINRRIKEDAVEMLEKAGFKDILAFDNESPPGHGIHEMGTARMGRDAKTSVLNAWNQVHACKNVFVTDGACMTSSSCVNPSLTYMALTARAANYAVEELKKNNL